MYEKKCWSEGGLTNCWAGRGKIKIAYLYGFGFIPKWLEEPHPKLVH
jgi:hypothetical protein